MAKQQIQHTKADNHSVEVRTLTQDTPLPNPEELKGYQNVHEDLVPFFMEMARKEQEMRHEISRAQIEAKEREDKIMREQQALLERNDRRQARLVLTAQIFALFCFLATIAICFFALIREAYWVSTIIATLAIGTVVQAYLTKK